MTGMNTGGATLVSSAVAEPERTELGRFGAARHDLAAAEWARIAPLLPARETKGTYYADHQRVLNGILYRHATG